jgi:predicted RNase H-like HicB family nuclease
MLKAKQIADEYRIILERDDRLGYMGSSVEIPTVFADGQTPDKCYRAIHEALMVAVATIIESGQKPPLPASSGKRTVQVNVRLTAQEKLLLTDEAMRFGFKGISDFIRSSALRNNRPSRRLFDRRNIRSSHRFLSRRTMNKKELVG